MFSKHLDTAPILEAFALQTECPLCQLYTESEAGYVDGFLGGSVMEPSVRIEVNEKGFCRKHLVQLLEKNSRLPLALMADTHLQDVIGRIERDKPSGARRSFFGKRDEPTTADAASRSTETCILCDRLDQTMNRYVETVFHLWKTDPAFQTSLRTGKGFCVGHYAALCRSAAQFLSAGETASFLATLHDVQLQNLRRVEGELAWFTQKFDYRNQDKPWGESRDALERALRKLRGV